MTRHYILNVEDARSYDVDLVITTGTDAVGSTTRSDRAATALVEIRFAAAGYRTDVDTDATRADVFTSTAATGYKTSATPADLTIVTGATAGGRTWIPTPGVAGRAIRGRVIRKKRYVRVPRLLRTGDATSRLDVAARAVGRAEKTAPVRPLEFVPSVAAAGQPSRSVRLRPVRVAATVAIQGFCRRIGVAETQHFELGPIRVASISDHFLEEERVSDEALWLLLAAAEVMPFEAKEVDPREDEDRLILLAAGLMADRLEDA